MSKAVALPVSLSHKLASIVPMASLSNQLYFAIIFGQHLINCHSKRVNTSFFVRLIYQSDLRVVDTVNKTSSLVSAQTFFQPRRQEEILYCCKISKLFYGQVFYLSNDTSYI